MNQLKEHQPFWYFFVIGFIIMWCCCFCGCFAFFIRSAVLKNMGGDSSQAESGVQMQEHEQPPGARAEAYIVSNEAPDVMNMGPSLGG